MSHALMIHAGGESYDQLRLESLGSSGGEEEGVRVCLAAG